MKSWRTGVVSFAVYMISRTEQWIIYLPHSRYTFSRLIAALDNGFVLCQSGMVHEQSVSMFAHIRGHVHVHQHAISIANSMGMPSKSGQEVKCVFCRSGVPQNRWLANA